MFRFAYASTYIILYTHLYILFQQNSLIDYFLGTREEKFFFAIKNRMQLSAIATKEK